MPKKIKIALLVLVLILIVGGSVVIAALSVYKPDVIKGLFNKPYSVVYLSTGEIYIGKLSTFPRMILKDIYLLQLVPDAEGLSQSSYQLVPLSNTLWSPQKIYLNKEQVIFTAPVRDDSAVAQTLMGQGGIPTGQPQGGQPSGVAPQDTIEDTTNSPTTE